MKYDIEYIVKNELCVGCGICTSESKSSRMVWDDKGFLTPILDGSFNDRAVKVCPFNPLPEKEVYNEDVIAKKIFGNSKNFDNRLGQFENTYIGYSRDFRENSSSGGIATYIFKKLLQHKIVDHLYIVKEIDGTYQYQWFNSLENINNISKTRYIPVTLEKLFEEIDSKKGKVAVSGVACFVKAIRLKQYYNPEYKEKIPFIVGIICGGLKSKFYTDYLAKEAGVDGYIYHDQDYRIKDVNSSASDYSFGVFDNKDTYYQVKMSKLGDMWGTGLFKSNACDFCDDVTTELADISLGDAWLPDYRNQGLGNSIIITRSILADKLVVEGIASNELQVNNVNKGLIIKSQEGSFRHRQDSMLFRLNLQRVKLTKRKRFYKNINFYNKIIQLARRNTRFKSLNIWIQTNGNLNLFKKNMSKHLLILKTLNLVKNKLKNIYKF